MPMPLQYLQRYAQTLRHLTPEQIRWRVRFLLERRAGWRIAPAPVPTPARFNGLTLDRLEEHLRQRAALCPADPAVRRGSIQWLGRAVEFGDAPPWAEQRHGRLWQYKLHYFDFLRELAALHQTDPASDDSALALAWVHDWIRRNPPGADVAWDAFCIAARLVNWALAESVFRWNDPVFRESIALQTGWLLTHLERDIQGNHLLKNAVALVVVGNLIGGRAAGAGRTLLEEQVALQELTDGGHFERSPMYHALVLEDLLVAHGACADKPLYLSQAVRRMGGWLRAMLHPDGEIPLFADSVLGEALPPAALLGLCGAAGLELDAPDNLNASGYHVHTWDGGASRLLVKSCGPEPPHQPGHAHADPFTFELSVAGLRMVVDSGVHGYAESPHRGYCRSVRAHNCAAPSGKEPMDAWGVFRVGRRFTTKVLDWQSHAEGCRFAGEHDGFAPHTLRRELIIDAARTLTVADSLEPCNVTFESYLHFHPEVGVHADGAGFVAERDTVQLRVVPEAGVTARLESPRATPPEGWCFEHFGGGRPAAWLVLSSQPGAASLGYTIYLDRAHG